MENMRDIIKAQAAEFVNNPNIPEEIKVQYQNAMGDCTTCMVSRS